jgi:hypothetical protein
MAKAGQIVGYEVVAGGSAIPQFCAVALAAGSAEAKKFVQLCTAGARPEGVSIEGANVTAGQVVSYYRDGEGVYLKCNGNSVNIVLGSPIKIATGGVGVVAEADGDWLIGFAEKALTADGVHIPIRISIQRHFVAASS